MGWSGFHFAFELGDAVAKEHRQFGCGEIIPVAARALLYQLEGETKIRGKFAGRLWTHSTDPDCEMRETAKTLSARKHHCLENLGYCFLSLPSEGCSRACQSDAHGPSPQAQSMTDEGARPKIIVETNRRPEGVFATAFCHRSAGLRAARGLQRPRVRECVAWPLRAPRCDGAECF